LSLKEQLININRRFRFEVFIDSLQKINNVELKYTSAETRVKGMDKIHSHFIGNKESDLHFYFIADYDCPSCINNYERVLNICKPYLDKLQFHFVYYSGNISEKSLIAEAVGNQDKFWAINQSLFEFNCITDSVIHNIVNSYSLDSIRFYSDYRSKIIQDKLKLNMKIIENLNIYSVPAIIIDSEIFPGYTNSNELIQIINYKLLKN
jgi:predicted DsbA family dithiol-disulfide isomerase